MTYTPDEFLASVEAQLVGVPFEQRDLIEFVGACRPMLTEAPDAAVWAARFRGRGPERGRR